MSIHKRIQRGVKLLNKKRPGWYNEIELPALNMSSPCFCVLGQLHGGSYSDGLTSLGIEDQGENEGFEVVSGRNLLDQYVELEEAWHKVIEELQQNGP